MQSESRIKCKMYTDLTSFVFFTNEQVYIQIGGVHIERVNENQFLGVIIDEKIS